jgi:outer membrane receptor protein involved in Fe transport
VPAIEREWSIPSINSITRTGYGNGSTFTPGGWYSVAGWPIFCTAPATFFGGDSVTNLFTDTSFIGNGLTGLYQWLGQWNGTSGPFANGVGCPSGRSASGSLGNGRNGFTRYDYAMRQDIINGQDVFSAAFYGTYDVTNWMTGFLEFQHSIRESDSRLDGNPGSFGTPAYSAGSVVPYTNPFLPSYVVSALDPTHGGPGFGNFAFRPSETIGVRQSTTDNATTRVVVGVQGDDLFDMFSWELSYLWTQNHGNLFTDSVWNLARFNRISDPYACGLDAQCAAVLTAGGKTPFSYDANLGIWSTSTDGALDALRPGNWTAAEIAYMSQNTVSTTDFETANWSGLISADVFELPAGPIGVAAGFEYREEQGFNKPDPFTEGGESVANAVGTTRGEFDVTEFFGEIFIPVFSGMQWAEELTVSLQGRWFDYSTFGDDTTWKVGINYQITPSWRVRYNQGTAFRSPDVSEAFGGSVASFDFFTDPCNQGSPERQGVGGANVALNCALSVGPNTLSGPLIGSFSQLSAQYAVSRGSNPNLGPETAETMSIGLIYTPTYLPNFSATLDWWQIEVSNFIGINTSDSYVDGCYQGAVGLTNPNCALFTRNAAGAIVGLVNLPSNFNAAVATDGIDWKVNYFWDQLGGTFSFDFEGTHVWDNSFFPGEGGLNNNTGSIVQTSMLTSLNYSRNNWGLTWRTRITGDLDDPNFNGQNFTGYDGAEEHVEHDIRGTYQWNNYGFLLGVNNLFDEEPPFAIGSSSNADVFTYSAVGRYYFARVSADF